MYILQLGIYYNSALLIFCFVLASCNYTLIKSVQPDPSSPTHVQYMFLLTSYKYIIDQYYTFYGVRFIRYLSIRVYEYF